MHRGSAYGLTLVSDFQLPVWLRRTSDDDAPRITLSSHSFEPVVDVAPTELGHRYSRDRAHLTFPPDGADFLVEGGERIVVSAPPTVDLRTVHASLSGPVLGVLMVQRGAVTLHAGAVRVGDAVVAVTGPSGAGKSTLTAALALESHPLVTDDVLAIADRAMDPHSVGAVVPSHPLVKLWPDAARALGLRVERLPRLEPGFDKLAFDRSADFDPRLSTLGAIAVLSDVDAPQRLSAADAFIELVRALYAPVAQRAAGEEHLRFQRLAALARAGLVHRFPYRADAAPLDAARRLVEWYEELQRQPVGAR